MINDVESEKRLVDLASNRDKEAFSNLYDLNVDNVYKHVYYHTGNQDVAEDITQEVFIRAWKALPKYRHRGVHFISWLLAISNNLMADHYHSYKKTSLAYQNLRTEIVSSSEHVHIQKLFVQEAVSRLTDIRRTVILMRFIEGFTFREIGKFLNKSEGAVRVIQHRAIQDLRTILFIGQPEKDEKNAFGSPLVDA